MNNLFVEYDLNKPGQDYPKVHEAIKALGAWARIHPSFWYVKSPLTASQMAEKIWRAMDHNDSLIVVDATNNQCSWFHLKPEVEAHLKSYWLQAGTSPSLRR
jgi:hypothetical protein